MKLSMMMTPIQLALTMLAVCSFPNAATAQVSNLVLVSTDKLIDDDIVVLEDGDMLNLAVVGKELSIRAETVEGGDPILSIAWGLQDDPKYHVESTRPFLLRRNVGRNYRPVAELGVPGEISVSATPYYMPFAWGPAKDTKTVRFTLMDFDITRLVLVETDTDTDVAELSLDNPDENIFDMALIGNNLSVRADTYGPVESVVFDLNEIAPFRTELNAPFMMRRNDGDDFTPVKNFMVPGTFVIGATAYSRNDPRKGIAGNVYGATLVLMDSSSSSSSSTEEEEP